jgi:CHAT domain-containing protein
VQRVKKGNPIVSTAESEITQTMTKAEALRNAQLRVLREPKFREHPYYWAPYVLLGNWL